MSNLKMVGAVGIMIVCFAIIYPRFMHPLVLRALGLYEPPNKDTDSTMYPPSYKAMHPDRKHSQEDMKKQMRPGPHPGMRAAAEIQRQQTQQGSGRGMMGVILPMYAVGIVLYLIYTLFKVFNKSKSKSWSNQNGQHSRRSQHGNTLDRMGFPSDFDGTGDVRSFLSDHQQRQDLEDLLMRVDDKNCSIDEMRILQKRLEETEAQMTRILQAMQSVQNNVDRMNFPQVPTYSQENPNDLSPDKDGYEVVNSHVAANAEGKGADNETSSKDTTEDHCGQRENDKGTSQQSRRKEKTRKLKKEVDLDGIDSDEDEITNISDEDKNDGKEEKTVEEQEAWPSETEKGSEECNVRQRKKQL